MLNLILKLNRLIKIILKNFRSIEHNDKNELLLKIEENFQNTKKKLSAYEEIYKEDTHNLMEKIKDLKAQNEKVKNNIKQEYEEKINLLQNNFNEKLIDKNQTIEKLLHNLNVLKKDYNLIFNEKANLEKLNEIIQEENENLEKFKIHFGDVLKEESPIQDLSVILKNNFKNISRKLEVCNCFLFKRLLTKILIKFLNK